MKVINRVLPHQVMKHKSLLEGLRENYEKHFRDLIELLPLEKSIDKDLLRLMILGSANHSQFWFNNDKGFTPEEVGKKFSQIIIEPIYSKDNRVYKSNVAIIERSKI